MSEPDDKAARNGWLRMEQETLAKKMHKAQVLCQIPKPTTEQIADDWQRRSDLSRKQFYAFADVAIEHARAQRDDPSMQEAEMREALAKALEKHAEWLHLTYDFGYMASTERMLKKAAHELRNAARERDLAQREAMEEAAKRADDYAAGYKSHRKLCECPESRERIEAAEQIAAAIRSIPPQAGKADGANPDHSYHARSVNGRCTDCGLSKEAHFPPKEITTNASEANDLGLKTGWKELTPLQAAIAALRHSAQADGAIDRGAILTLCEQVEAAVCKDSLHSDRPTPAANPLDRAVTDWREEPVTARELRERADYLEIVTNENIRLMRGAATALERAEERHD